MADTVKTREQLINRALKSLAIIESGEAPAIEDYTTVDDMVDPLIAQLASDGIVLIQDPEAVELEYYEPLARLLANACGPDFGSPLNEEARQRDEKILRRLAAQKPPAETLKVSYF
jgi:hypothetical protein